MELGLNFRKVIIWTLICVVLLWASSLFLLKLDNDLRGTIGDIFSVVSTLFSGLAFGGIIITILLQRQELVLQREELRCTREELKRTADSQEESLKALERQADNFKISSKLTALNTLVSYYAEIEKEQRIIGGYSFSEATKKRVKYIRSIEELLDERKKDF